MKKYVYSFLLNIFAFASVQAAPGSGNALSFDGDDYISVPNTSLLFLSTRFSIEAWINPSVNGHNTIMSNGVLTDLSTVGFSFSTVAGTTSPRLSFAYGALNFLSPNNSIPLNKWSHVAVTIDQLGNSLRFYINGTLVTSSTGLLTITMASSPLNIGRNSRNSNRFFTGIMDEVRVFNAFLTQATIQSYMCQKVTPSHPNYANLTGYYNLDEGTGSVTANLISTVSSTLGSLVGPTWVLSSAPIGNGSAFVYSAVANSNCVLPHANGSFMTARLTSGTATALQLYRVDEAPNSAIRPTSLTTVYTNAYWGVKMFGASADAKYEVTYNYNGTPSIVNENMLTLASRNDNATSAWVLPATSSTLNLEYKQLNLGNQTGTEFLMGGFSPTPLPMELIEWGVVFEKNNVTFHWATASENNTDYFAVERSTDTKTWEKIAVVAAAGKSLTRIDYYARDTEPLRGTAYYRLKQYDFDGSETSSTISTIINDQVEKAVVFPNPTDGNFLISGTGLNPEDVQIFNSKGQLVAANPAQQNGILIFNMDLVRGVYYVKIQQAGEVQTVQMILSK